MVIMLKLDISRESLNRAVIKFAVSHVIRDGKRWGRYPMNLSKDCRRIKTLLHRTTPQEWQKACAMAQEPITPASVAGWRENRKSDLISFFGSDILEIIAIMEYWNLWQYSNEILKLA